MSDNTHIEWTDATWNPVTGCTVHSPGCTNCYAMKLAGTRLQHHPSRAGLTRMTKAGPVWTGEVRFNEQWLTQPLRWKKPRRIFVCAHADLFHENVPDEWIDRVFAVMARGQAAQHTFQVLTKRSARMRDYLSRFVPTPAWDGYITRDGKPASGGVDKNPAGSPIFSPKRWPLPNVWLGVSVEDQTRADERIPDLLATPAAVRWISAEPLLGPVDLTNITGAEKSREYGSPVHGWSAIWRNNGIGRAFLDWIVVGGESGPGARPMHPDWARSLRDQCAAAGVPFLFKQWGEWSPCEAVANASGGVDMVPPVSFRAVHRWRRWEGNASREAIDDESVGEFLAPGLLAIPDGKARAGRLLDGVQHDGYPA